MSQVITFIDYTPAPRFDGNPWTLVDIQEADTEDGTWATIETITLDPVDDDPEFPMSRSFTTEDASDTLGLWYRLIFRDQTGDEEQPTLPVQNVASRAAYATVEELARVLKLRDPQTRWQELRRCIETAAIEIDAELGRAAPFSSPPALVVQVNLERAVEHWRQQEAPFGLIGLGTEFGGGAERVARDSWDRHAHKLAPLKESWGIA